MADEFDTGLRERFAVLRGSAGEGDWGDVVVRAAQMSREASAPAASRPRSTFMSRRRLVVLVAILALLTALAVTPAFGLRSRIESLFGLGEPAPTPAVKSLQILDVGARPGMESGARAGEARTVLRRGVLPDVEAVIWATPGRDQRVCEATGFRHRGRRLQQFTAGCWHHGER